MGKFCPILSHLVVNALNRKAQSLLERVKKYYKRKLQVARFDSSFSIPYQHSWSTYCAIKAFRQSIYLKVVRCISTVANIM